MSGRREPQEPPNGAGAPAASEDGAGPTAGGGAPGGSAQPVRHRKLPYVTLPGSWGAVVLGCLSCTPSLLPRGDLIQGMICGITAAIGYGLGVLAACVWRAFADREPRPARRWAWPAFSIGAPILFGVSPKADREGPEPALRDAVRSRRSP